MKTKKVATVSVAVVLVLAGLALVGYIGGCRPHPFGGNGFCPGFRDKGFGPRFGGADFLEHVLSRVDRRVEELNLSDDQKNRYEELRGQFKENFLEGLEERKRFHNDVREEMSKENPDVHEVIARINEGLREIPGFMEKNLNLLVAFYDTLDDDQQARVIARIRAKMDCEPIE
jgi:hypothetical protein